MDSLRPTHIRDGGHRGLGVRSVALLAPSAFPASAAATLDLQDAILSEVEQEFDNFVSRVAARWSEMFNPGKTKGVNLTPPRFFKIFSETP